MWRAVPIFPNNVFSRYHRYSGAPHDAIIVIAYAGAPLPLVGIENQIITPFLTCCSGAATYAITTIA
jgi:hypothetical protein